MALNTSNNYLQNLIIAGNDAHSNLYEIVFSGGEFDKDTNLASAMSVRTSGFTAPDTKQDTYSVKYITAYIDRPKTKVNVTRNFNLDFRLDSYWEVYKLLVNQQKVTMNAAHSFAATDMDVIKSKMFHITVYALHEGLSSETISTTDRKKLYEFKYCWITNLNPSEFSNTDSNPLKVTAAISFLEMYDLESGFPGDSGTTTEDTSST